MRKNHMKATALTILASTSLSVILPITSFAETSVENNINTEVRTSVDLSEVANGVDKEYTKNKEIKNFTDIQSLIKEDEAKYEKRFNEIPSDLKKDFNKFSNKYENEIRNNVESLSVNLKSGDPLNQKLYIAEISNKFLEEYPSYTKINSSTLNKDLEILAFNPVVSTVRAFFEKKGFGLSLMFFNHSLNSNPSNINIDLIDKSSGTEKYIKNLLTRDNFYWKMADFAIAGRNYETKTDSSYAFNNKDGDLYWAIHGFTWKRTRTKYDKAYFKINDVYDFNKWKDIPGIVAGFSGTNDYNIEIYGLMELGLFR